MLSQLRRHVSIRYHDIFRLGAQKKIFLAIIQVILQGLVNAKNNQYAQLLLGLSKKGNSGCHTRFPSLYVLKFRRVERCSSRKKKSGQVFRTQGSSLKTRKVVFSMDSG